MTLYRNMDKNTLEREYSPSSCVDDIMIYINQYIEQSRIAKEKLKHNLIKDVKYGSEPRSRMDIFTPKGTKKSFPIHVFIHGGYWQELSNEESAFAAPNFIDHDIIFIALDYTLAPKANLFEIVSQVRKGIVYIIENAEKYGGDKNNITISGSSAGGHLVAEILSMDWQKYGYEKCPLKGALAISGIYDLEPIVHNYVKMVKDGHFDIVAF
jgi:arylformamidase